MHASVTPSIKTENFPVPQFLFTIDCLPTIVRAHKCRHKVCLKDVFFCISPLQKWLYCNKHLSITVSFVKHRQKDDYNVSINYLMIRVNNRFAKHDLHLQMQQLKTIYIPFIQDEKIFQLNKYKRFITFDI